MDAAEFLNSRRQSLGGGSSPADSFLQNRKMELGLIPRPAAPHTPQYMPDEMVNPDANIQGAADSLHAQIGKFRDGSITENLPQPIQGPPDPANVAPRPGRDLPIVGPVLRGLDAVADNPVVQTIGELGRDFYTPGAGVANIAGMTGAVGGLLGKVAPKLGSTLGGRVAQEAIKEGVTGFPVGMGQSLATGNNDVGEAAKQGAFGAAAGGVLGAGGKALLGAATRFGDQAATGLAQNAFKNVAENSRVPVKSPFSEDFAAANPIAKGYTENVGRTFAQDRGLAPDLNVQNPTAYKIGDNAMPTSTDGTRLSEPSRIVDVQQKDGTTYYRFDGSNTYMPENQVVRPSQEAQTTQPIAQTAKLSDVPVQSVTDELKFAQTVKDSPHTSPDLVSAMNEQPMIGRRTSDVLNLQEAQKLIEKHGTEGLYSKLMSKTKQFSASETTAAQILAKQFSSAGGDGNLSKAIDLVSKTAKGGREMGQAIQALSQWNKLDETGALYLGEKQLNKGVPTEEWKTLTPAQGAPIKEAAQRIGSAQETRSLADEVLNIVTNKPVGEALTEAEKATVKQFQDQVKLINQKGKGILPQTRGGKTSDTIAKISQIEPKARTRDQVVSFLDAKAEKARQRIANSRNIGIVPQAGDPIADWAIVGASYLAKKVVKMSDFAETMVRDFGQAIKPHINEVYARANRIWRKENGLPTVEELDRVVNKAVKDERFSPDDAVKFKAWAAEIGHMSEEFKKEATQTLQMALKELGDSTLGQKVATVQTGSMLLNSATMERNALGNVSQLVLEKMQKFSTVPVDWTLSKLTGEQRTIYFKPQNQAQFWRDFMEGTKAGWKGVSPSGTLDSYGIHPNVFGNKNPLKYLTKTLGASLQGFDYAFYNHAKGEVLATYAEQLGKAKGMTKAEIKAGMKDLITQLDDRIHELADHSGQYATYQDDTLLSKGAEKIRKGLNAPTDFLNQKLVDMGLPKKLSMEGFGAGDVVLKFAKTPANLIMRGLDYSPIGFIRSTMELAPLIFNRANFNQSEASRVLGRAITGSLGLTGMGFILADAGILTGSSSMDKDVRSIQEQSGQGAYKVNWSALGRFLANGFDYNAAKYQKGDSMMDYAWLQPAAISVAMGVNAQKAWGDRKNAEAAAGWQRYGKAILGGLGSVLENPMVQGVSSVIDATTDLMKKQDPTKLFNIGKGIPASFVPTLSNQARAATDNNQRETFDKNIFVEMGNLMKNKVPVLSKTLPVSYDSLGNARERIQGGQANTVGQYLTSFFSPAKMTEYQVSPEAKLVLDLMNQSGDPNVLPRIENRYIHVSQGKNIKDLKVNLTAEQYSELQHSVGQLVTSKLSVKSEYLANPNISLKNKVDTVKTILTDAGTKAREQIGTQMGFQKRAIKR